MHPTKSGALHLAYGLSARASYSEVRGRSTLRPRGRSASVALPSTVANANAGRICSLLYIRREKILISRNLLKNLYICDEGHKYIGIIRTIRTSEKGSTLVEIFCEGVQVPPARNSATRGCLLRALSLLSGLFNSSKMSELSCLYFLWGLATPPA